MDLAWFLMARIAEDEAVARAVGDQAWLYHGLGTARLESDVAEAKLQHSDRWMPSRVLAECEAKRRLVAMASPDLLGVLTALALPYASHPDYQPEWKP